jgi:trimeric autotransporter adhesin
MKRKASLLFLLVCMVCMVCLQPIHAAANGIYIEKAAQTNVYEWKKWRINFNTTLDKSSVNGDNVFVTDGSGSSVAVNVTAEDNVITIAPAQKYSLGQTYDLYIQNIKSASGKVMQQPVHMPFTITNTPSTTVHALSVGVGPDPITMFAGQKKPETVKALLKYDNGVVVDVTKDAIWTSSNTAVATVQQGKITPTTTVGSTTVNAALTVNSQTYTDTINVQVNPNTVSKLTITPATLSLGVGQDSAVKATALFADGSTADVTKDCTWTPAPSNLLTVINGVAIGKTAGSGKVDASYGGVSANVDVTVVNAVSTANDITLTKGQSVTLKNIITYSNGTIFDATSQSAWSTSASGVVSVDSKGKVSALAVTGGIPAVVKGVYNGVTYTANVTVIDKTLKRISIVTPSSTKFEIGDTFNLKVLAEYSDGTSDDITKQSGILYDWNVSPANLTVDNTGKFTAVSPGSGVITAKYPDPNNPASSVYSNSVNFDVYQLTSIKIVQQDETPVPSQMDETSTITVKAIGTFDDGTNQYSEDIASKCTWYSTDNTIITADKGKLTAIKSAGNQQTSISAAYQGITSPSVSIQVNTRICTNLSVIPSPTFTTTGTPPNTVPNMDIKLGGTGLVKATVTYQDGTTENVSNKAVYSIGNPSIISVDNKGTVTPLSSGQTTLTVKFGQKIDAATGTKVDNSQTINIYVYQIAGSLLVSPAAPSIEVGKTVPLKAYLTFEALGSPTLDAPASMNEDITSKVVWSSSNSSVASVDSKGVVTGQSIPTPSAPTAVNAVYNNIINGGPSLNGTANITLIASSAATRDLASLAITPITLPMLEGASAKIKVMATYSDGKTEDVTNQIMPSKWTVEDSTIISTPDLNGAVVAQNKAGRSKLTAQFMVGSNTKTADAWVTVSKLDPVLQITGPNIDNKNSMTSTQMALGQNGLYKAVAIYKDEYGNETSRVDVTNQVLWNTDRKDIALVDKGKVSAIGVNAGNASITALLSLNNGSTASGSFSVNVAQNTVQSLKITPNQFVLKKGDTAVYKVMATYMDGSTKDVTADPKLTVTFATSGIGQIGTPPGKLIAVGSGTTKVNAVYDVGAVANPTIQADLTVNDASNVTITTSSVSFIQGDSGTVKATGYFGGQPVDITKLVQWDIVQSDGSAFASNANKPFTIDSAGKITIIKPVPYKVKIQATYNSHIYLSNPIDVSPIDSMRISPAAVSVLPGDSVALQVIATYQNGRQKDITKDVSFAFNGNPIPDNKVLIPAAPSSTDSPPLSVIASLKSSVDNGGVTVPTAQSFITVAGVNGIFIDPPILNLLPGKTATITVTATFSNGKQKDVTNLATWTTTGPNATISGNKVTASYSGSVTLTALYGKFKNLIINVASPGGVVVTP